MSPAIYDFLLLIGAPLSSVVALITLAVSGAAWMRRQNPMDFLLALVMLGWLVFLFAGSDASKDENPSLGVYVARAGYQVAVFGTSLSLLLGASVTRFEAYAFWTTHGVAAMLLVGLAWSGPPGHDLFFELSEKLNLACACSLSLLIGLMVYRQETFRRWLALAGSLVAIAICVEDLRTTDHTHLGVPLAQYFFAALLLLFWHLLTDRVGIRRPVAVPASASPEPSEPSYASAGPPSELARQAVAEERRRIALDLHDGVGSQLVRILATLESNMPHQQALALTLELEHCLRDLKLTVDRIDGADDSVIDALGRLRYRVQPALDKLGIRLIWSTDVDGPLQQFKGEPAQEILCIVQEALSNVIRHASATVVVVICRYVATSNVMLLEVRDNGRGAAASRSNNELSGKGLEGMRRRARKLAGHFQISMREGLGTRIRLSVPLETTGQRPGPTLDDLPVE